MHSKSPCRRSDEGFRSAGEDDSENQEFRDLNYYIYRYGCPIEKNKNKVTGMPSVLFAFCTVYCSRNRLKIHIIQYGESSNVQLTELKFKV